MSIKLGTVYTNTLDQRLQPYHFDLRGGLVNARVHCHNFTTGYDETWTIRLFLAEHTREGR